MKAEEFVQLLDGVKRQGQGWEAICPAHEDKHPSLSISQGEDRILLHCHAGCEPAAVLDAKGLKWGDVFVEREPTKVATYHYLNENRGLAYQVIRFEPKSFKQRRPVGGSWVWNMEGVERIPYRLPELIEARGSHTIFIPEGEKDVDRIIAAGGEATCAPGGAGKWPEGWGQQYFQGADVRIVADRDDPGYQHAQDIYNDLLPWAEQVSIVEAARGKDAYDHLESGAKLDEFVPVARNGSLDAQAAAVWFLDAINNPPAPDHDGIPTPWMSVIGRFKPGRFYLLGGYPADGKTAIALQFMRTACEAKNRVDFFSIEMTAEELVERLVSAYGVPYEMTQSKRIPAPYRDVAVRAVREIRSWPFEIHDAPGMGTDEIERLIEKRKTDLAIIDHVHAFGHKDRFEIETAARNLKAIAKRQKTAMLVLAHVSRARKFKPNDTAFPRPDMGRLRESGMLEAWADAVLFTWMHRDANDMVIPSGELILAKSRFKRPTSCPLTFNGVNQIWEGGYAPSD